MLRVIVALSYSNSVNLGKSERWGPLRKLQGIGGNVGVIEHKLDSGLHLILNARTRGYGRLGTRLNVLILGKSFHCAESLNRVIPQQWQLPAFLKQGKVAI
jgi:hypothetical protein